MRRRFLFLCLAMALAASAGRAQPGGPPSTVPRHLIVGTKEAVPFSIREADGSWRGISIDLWREIAAERGWTFELQERSLDGLLEGVQDGSLDVAVAALTVTADREARLDFTHPFYTTGFGIAVPTRRSGSFGFVRRLLSTQFLAVVGGLASLLLAVGALVWLLERRRNADQFGGSAAHGLGAGFWWSAVTMTTVGYGDKAPVTPAGRIVGLVWMFASLVAISTFTAAIASSLTVDRLQSAVQGPQDLPKVVVGTVPSSTSEAYLDERGVSVERYATVGAALEALATGKVGAVVYDAPILRYLIKNHYRGRVSLLPGTFRRQDYAIALPEGSGLREPINVTMLRLLKQPVWDSIVTKYVGTRE
jgi:polar amino acid transport system substrate-binding protein